ncbi:Copia protein, partial [Mucuna pruriens]
MSLLIIGMKSHYMSADVTFFEKTMFFTKDNCDSIQQALPIPYLSLTESSSLETHNQDILQPSSSVHSQAELSPPLMSTCQSRTQEMDTPVCEDSCPLSSTDPTPNPLPSLPSHDSNIGIRSTRNPHPIYLSYHHLSPSYFSFVSSVSSITIYKSVCEALDHPRWRQAMIVEMQALEQSGTWELVSLPSGKKAVGCRWVFAIKVAPNGTVDRLKARLVAKGYTQVYGLDYGDTFSLVAKITTIRLLLAMAAIRHWPLHQLDIKNAFLHGDLDEEIYMEQPPGFVAQGESGLTKNLGHLKYFLGIEIAQSKEGIVISQRKYVFDILQETSISNCKPVDSPMDPNMKLMVKHGEPYSDPLIQRVGVVSQFMQAPCVDHWAVVLCILRYIKKTPGQSLLYENKGDIYISGYCDANWARSIIGFCISIGGNVVSWKSKKQNTVARSSAEVEYWAMASATCELIWVKQFIQELKFVDVQPMKMYCDNQVALHIASNPVFHQRTKHIEIDCHFVQEKLLAKEISTEFVNSSNQLADIFTKSLRGPQIQVIRSKLGAYNLYAPA